MKIESVAYLHVLPLTELRAFALLNASKYHVYEDDTLLGEDGEAAKFVAPEYAAYLARDFCFAYPITVAKFRANTKTFLERQKHIPALNR